MPNPTRQEIIDAYKALEELYDWALELAGTLAHSRYGAIRDVLPPKPQPTMADVEWDDDKHYLAEANYPYHGRVIMLFEKDGWIHYFDERKRDAYAALASTLTPTGKRYTLTEVHDD